MPRAVVEALLYLLDDGFEGGRWHSLLGNLADVAPEEWEWLPPGGARSLRAIVHHVGVCKLMYENHAFGDASLTWGSVDPPDATLAAPAPALACSAPPTSACAPPSPPSTTPTSRPSNPPTGASHAQPAGSSPR